MAGHRTIAINMTIVGGAQRNILRGIVRYSQVYAHWTFLEHKGESLVLAPHLKHYKYDGLLTCLNNADDVNAARTSKVPVVAVTNGLPCTGIPMVRNNDTATGEMAAHYFLDKGFRRFAYYGAREYDWAIERGRSFSRVIEQRGFSVDVMGVPYNRNSDKAMARLIRWLAAMRKPVAVMTSDDRLGVRVLAACERAAINIPEEVAVLSVDNDDVLCDMVNPPLSSIQPDSQRIGFKAAAILAGLMDGADRQPQVVDIPPIKIVPRISSDTTAIDDPEVAEILRLIRTTATQPQSVKEVLRSAPMSRRTLERRFIKAIGRNPGEEIRRVRLERAKQLLRDSKLKIERVAAESGFGDARMLASAFRRSLRITPSKYRDQFRDQ